MRGFYFAFKKFFAGHKLLWLFIIAYVLILGSVSIARHYNFQTQTWDMGIFDQIMWNSAHGRWMQNSIEETSNHLGVHMSPWLFALVPGYFLFPTPYYLLILQTLGLGLGTIPLYFLGLKILQSRKGALAIAGAYLLYPSLHWINLFDFHSVAFFVPLFLAGFYFMQEGRWRPAIIFLALAASTKENAILVVMFLGLYMVFLPSKGGFLNKKRLAGILIAIFSLTYFIVAIKIVMPYFGGGLLRFDRYAALGATPQEVIKNVFANPVLAVSVIFSGQKLFYLFVLFAPLVLYPLLSWRALFLLLPGLAQNLLTSYGPQFSGQFQYDAILLPGLFIGALYGLRWLRLKWPAYKNIFVWVLVFASMAMFLWRSPVNPITFPYGLFGDQPIWRAYRQMVEMVPDGASVAAHTNLVPHLSQRQNIFMLGAEPFAPDVILIDGASFFGFNGPEGLQAYADYYTATGEYEIKVIDNRFGVFIRR